MNDTNQPSFIRAWLYALVGFVLGLIIVAIATWIIIVQAGLPLVPGSVIDYHLGHPAIWILDLVPFALALIFGLLGRREVTLSRTTSQISDLLQERNSEIDQLHAEVESKSTEIVRGNNELARQMSESQQAFETVDQARREWEAVFASMSDLIVLTDVNGKIMRCNRATTQAFQLETDQILGMQVGELFYGRSGPGQEQLPEQRAELKFPRLEHWYEVMSNSLVTESGEQGRIYLLRDISDRQQATLTGDRQRQYYEALVKNFPMAFVTLNLDLRIVDCNPAFETLFGYPKQELFGQDLDKLIAPEERGEEALSLSQTVLKGEEVHQITQRRRKDGSLVDVELYGIPIILWRKQIGLLAVYHDVSGLIQPPEEVETTATPESEWVAEAALAALLAKPEEAEELVEPAPLTEVPLVAPLVSDTDTEVMGTRVEEIPEVVEPGEEMAEAGTLPEESSRKPLQIEIIEGIGPYYADKLAAAGVTTTAELLKVAADRKGRETLAETTGLSRALILKWVNRADLMRVPGIGEEYSDLLEASGVDTVKELRNRNPENLHMTMAEVNADKRLVRRLPHLTEVQAWVQAAKELEPLLTY